MSNRSWWQRFKLRLRVILDQLMMILDLPTINDSPELRMARLRRIYYDDADVNVKHRRVRDVLRGYVHKDNYVYYEQILSVERVIYHSGGRLGGRSSALLYHTQHLGNRIVNLIDELEDIDDVAKLYGDTTSDAARQVQNHRDTILRRIKDALEVHRAIPARLVTLGATQSDRDITRLQDRIERLALELDDIAATYEEIDETVRAFETGEYSSLGDKGG
ncbi:MAG: hypothetical protein L0154_23115 [Chloroflexi bacterium]|nr:hypothetical protein [Chloroflexota bacterium]